MSTLKADTIVASDGTSPVTLTKQSAAKAWVNLNGTGTIAIRDSLNHSSATDSATGKYVFNFTNSFGNTSHVSSGLNNQVSPSGNYNRYASLNGALSASSLNCWSVRGDTAAIEDTQSLQVASHGDLA
jgi:hypothetical protein